MRSGQKSAPAADDTSTKGAVPGVRDTVWDQIHLAVPSNLKLTRASHTTCQSWQESAGQTGKTTAHLMPWNDDYYHEIESSWGTETMKVVAESHRGAIDFVERVVMEEGIQCSFTRVPGYLEPVEDSDSEAEKLRLEYEACKRGGFNSIRMVNLKHAPENDSFGTGILFPMTAEFQPLKYIQGLAQAIKRMGGEIYEETAVTEQNREVCKTDGGFIATGEAMVLATNSPIHKILAVHSRQSATRTYVVGLKVPKGAIKRAAWWDTASPYHYVRVEDYGDEEVLVVGGEDHAVGINPTECTDAYGLLEDWARSRWPAAQEVVYRWTGQVYEPADFLGLYGKNPLDPGNVYTATGDSGEGMTGGTIGGVVISSLILNRQHPWIDVYSPSRFPAVSTEILSSAVTEIQENIEGFSNLLPGRGVDSFSSETLACENEAVIQEGLNTVATFRDANCQVHRYSGPAGKGLDKLFTNQN